MSACTASSPPIIASTCTPITAIALRLTAQRSTASTSARPMPRPRWSGATHIEKTSRVPSGRRLPVTIPTTRPVPSALGAMARSHVRSSPAAAAAVRSFHFTYWTKIPAPAEGSKLQGADLSGVVVRNADRLDTAGIARTLDEVAAKIEKHGVKVERGSRALADERFVKDLIVCNDPNGNRLELFHGAETTTDPFKPGRSISGFRVSYFA